MTNILITGGAGFIGSHIAERLLQKSNEVTVLDNLDPYYDTFLKQKNIKILNKYEGFDFVEGDVRSKNLVINVFLSKDFEYVFHCAARPGVRESVKNPYEVNEINVNGTLNILDACLKYNVKKLIFASSSSVYGNVNYLLFDESHPTQPISPYGVSKLASEHYCRVFNEIYGLKTTSLRYFTVYGPRMRPDLAISIFVKQALENKPIEIFGDGCKTRDFTYISDVVEANILAVDKGDGEVYNIGSGNQISIRELAKKIIAITKSKSEIFYKEAQKGDAEHTCADIEKAKRELKWIPKTDIYEGLNKYIDWIKK